jgi:predicted Zn-dependent peptidase
MNPKFIRGLAALASLSFIVLVFSPAAALAQQKTPPLPGATKPITLPQITERKLDNGLTVVMAPLANVPKVTAQLVLRVDQAAEIERTPGVAGMAAAVANEGTDSRSGIQLKQELRSIGGYLNLGAGADSTNVFGGALAEFAPQLFALMSDVVQHPSFPQGEVDLAKANTIQSIRGARSNPGFLANERFLQAIYGKHPYSFVVADEKSIGALTRDDLRAFVAKYYIPNNAVLVLVGDFDPATAFGQVEKAFGSWARKDLPAVPTPTPPTRDKRQIYFVNRPGSVQSTIYLGNVTIPRKHADYFKIRTANSIYGGSFYSRLTKNIREEKGYTYSPFSGSNTQAISGYFQVGASVRNEVTGPTLVEIFYELDRMRVAAVTDEELSSAKTFANGNFSIELASQAGLAGRIATIYTYDLPRDFIEKFRANIDSLTPADIQQTAAKYFDSYRAAVVIVGDYAKVKDQVMPFGDVTVYDSDGNLVRP